MVKTTAATTTTTTARKQRMNNVVRFTQCIQVPMPDNAGTIVSVHWRPQCTAAKSSTSAFLVVTKTAAYVFTMHENSTKMKGPVRVINVPVRGKTSMCHWHDYTTVAFCGGGEFSVHAVVLDSHDAVEGEEEEKKKKKKKKEECTASTTTTVNQCLCVDLDGVNNVAGSTGKNDNKERKEHGAPRSLCSMASSDGVVMFACLTDTPVALPFQSGKRDRPLNEAIHMMRTARSKDNKEGRGQQVEQQDQRSSSSSREEQSTRGVPTATMDLSPLLLLEKSGSLSSLVVVDEDVGGIGIRGGEDCESKKGKKEEEEVIDLVGGMSRRNGEEGLLRMTAGDGGGGGGGTLAALMSISANRGQRKGTNPMLSVVGRAGEFARDNSSAAAPLLTPTLSVYEAKLAKDGRPTRIMRVHSSSVSQLSHGDIMACSPEHRLLAVSSNTSNKIHIYEYQTRACDSGATAATAATTTTNNDDSTNVIMSLRDTLIVSSSSSSSSRGSVESKGDDDVEERDAQLRVKGVSFQQASNSGGSKTEAILRVLVGVKIDSHAGFFSSGASKYAVELRTYLLPTGSFSPASAAITVATVPFVQPLPPRPPLSPPPKDMGGGGGGVGVGGNEVAAVVLDALQSFRSHVDARMDRMEGMLMMQSERLSRLERNRERCDA